MPGVNRSKSDGNLLKFIKRKKKKQTIDEPATLNEDRIKEIEKRNSSASLRKPRHPANTTPVRSKTTKQRNSTSVLRTSKSKHHHKHHSRSHSHDIDNSFSSSVDRSSNSTNSPRNHSPLLSKQDNINLETPTKRPEANIKLNNRSLHNSTRGLNHHTDKLTLMKTNASNNLAISNILVPLDNHSEVINQDNSIITKNSNNDNNKNLQVAKATTGSSSTNSLLDKRHTNMIINQISKPNNLKNFTNLNTNPEINKKSNSEVTTPTVGNTNSGIFNSLFSFGSSSHLPKIMVKSPEEELHDHTLDSNDHHIYSTMSAPAVTNHNPSDHHDSHKDTISHNNNNNDSSKNKDTVSTNNKDEKHLTSTNSHPTLNPNHTNNSIHQETILHSSLNAINRSNSFLRHLDFLLASPSSTNKERIKTITDRHQQQITHGNAVDASVKAKGSPFRDRKNRNSNPRHSLNLGALATAEEPSISTFGNGNLSLDILRGDDNDINFYDNDDEDITTNGVLRNPDNKIQNSHKPSQEFKRHSALSFSKIKDIDAKFDSDSEHPFSSPGSPTSELKATLLSRNTLSETNLEILKDNNNNNKSKKSSRKQKALSLSDTDLSDIELEKPKKKGLNKRHHTYDTKRSKRFSTLSNSDEFYQMSGQNGSNSNVNLSNSNIAATTNSPDERKSRRLSKNFLVPRSLSPSASIHIKSLPIGKSRFSNNMDPTLDIQIANDPKFRNIEYASEKKNMAFHSYFKNNSSITPQERLITDVVCALSRDILQQGKMYITDKNICFNSKILGWASSIVIPFNEIVQIKKKMTVGIFPNAIVIDTLQTKYIFASFISRDNVFDLITDVWNQIILGRRRSTVSQARHHEGSDIDSKMSVDSYSDSDLSSDERSIIMDGDEQSTIRSSRSNSESDIQLDTDITSSDIEDDSNLKSQVNVTQTYPRGPIKHAPTSHPYTPSPNDRKICDATFNYPMSMVSDTILGDTTDYYLDILHDQHNFDFSPMPKIISSKVRDYHYSKPLHVPMAPSKTICLINEVLDHYDLNDYIQMSMISKTPDVPSGNSFLIKSKYLWTWGPDNTTHFEVYTTVVWIGKSWLKSAIEKGTYDAVKETGQEMMASMTRILKTMDRAAYETPIVTKVSKPKKVKNSRKSEKSTPTASATITSNGLPTMEPKTHAPTEPTYQREKDDKVIIENANIQAPLGTVFQLLYGKDSSYVTNILKAQKNFDISKITAFSNKNNNTREYDYVKPLNNSLGPKQTKCFITEKLEYKDMRKFAMAKLIVKTPDVPSGNSFSVQSKTLLSWGPNNSTNITVLTNVVWTSRSFLKSAIEKGSIDGQKEATTIMLKKLEDFISKSKNKGSSKKKKQTKNAKEVPAPQNVAQGPAVSPLFREVEEIKSGPTSPMSQFIEFFTDTDITSIGGIFKILSILFGLFFLIRYIFRSGSSRSNVQILKPGRMMMNGVEYNFVPNVKTLYQVYEQEVRRSIRDPSVPNLIEETESDIWDWIKDRGYGSYEFDYNSFDKEANDLDDKKQQLGHHKYQQLEESIRIAELQLDGMKELLGKLE